MNGENFTTGDLSEPWRLVFHNKNQILEIRVNIYITVKIGDLQIGTFYSIFPLNVRCKDKVETAQLYNENAEALAGSEVNTNL